MKRYSAIIIILIFLSTVLFKGMHFSDFSVQQVPEASDTVMIAWKDKLIDSCGIPEPALNMAMNGYNWLKSENLLKNDSLITIIDFSSASTSKRFFILDVKNKQVIKNTWVAHGIQSGENLAESFSNKHSSNKSSLGLYVTRETYEGKHGFSLRLDGMTEGLNDNARERAIVIHGADYVSKDFIQETGRLGRSYGCPALPSTEVNQIIEFIKEGSCLFIYHPDLIPIPTERLEKLP